MAKAKSPKVTKGSHLTVIEHPDGRRELQWDDDALMRDVREAIDSLKKEPAKKIRRKKAQK